MSMFLFEALAFVSITFGKLFYMVSYMVSQVAHGLVSPLCLNCHSHITQAASS